MYNSDDPIFNTVEIGGHNFPGTWRYILHPDFINLKIPKEKLADCTNCPMVILNNYNPQYKCCTHFAQIPNFQIGLALKDPASRVIAQNVIDNGLALPTGIEITPRYYIESIGAHKKNLFGKSIEILCPFMDRSKGMCTIYPYRTVICTTFFCGHDHCKNGILYWEKLSEMAHHAERAITQWSMKKSGMNIERYMERLDDLSESLGELSGIPSYAWSKKAREYLYGSWFGKEAEFFEKCADHVMAHRGDLWEIGCSQDIIEALHFEEAVDNLLNIQTVDQANGQTNGETCNDHFINHDSSDDDFSLVELWENLNHATDKLYKLPQNGQILSFNNEAEIKENKMDSPLNTLFKNRPFYVTLISKTGDEPVTIFLTSEEKEALSLFLKPVKIENSIFNSIKFLKIEKPEEFISKFIGCNILIIQNQLND
ncbi:MAG: hypothetical protein JXR91_09080 [Deltaproteobacteria bacterium]|nr:hypothetical protein [Deltaproteobacteria bacterium]